jgi:hypothetical protein
MEEGIAPAARRELGDQVLRMGRHAEEHIFEIVERRDVHQFAPLDERVQQGGAARPLETAGDEPVLAAHGDDAELIFGAIIVNRESASLLEGTRGDSRHRFRSAPYGELNRLKPFRVDSARKRHFQADPLEKDSVTD